MATNLELSMIKMQASLFIKVWVLVLGSRGLRSLGFAVGASEGQYFQAQCSSKTA